MRITYITHTRFPTEKAHGHQVAQVCNALGNLGHEVTLVAPTVGTFEGSVQGYYGLSESFRFERLKNFDALVSPFVPGPLAFFVSMWSYCRVLKKYFSQHRSDLIYVRSPLLLSVLVETGIPVIVELHTLPGRKKSEFIKLFNKCKRVVALTTPMRNVLVEWGVDADRVIVEGDGVDLSRFEGLLSPPLGRPVVGYVGSFVTRNKIEKGVRELIDALALLKKEGKEVQGWIVGGPKEWEKRYEDHARSLGLTEDDVRFEGSILRADIPRALAACDVLVYPAPASKHPYFMRDTSPLKLFEYLAADRPIACADIPPIHDAVDERSVEFCTPGDAQSLADAIQRCLQEDPMAKSQRRRELAEWYSWEKRMGRILTGM